MGLCPPPQKKKSNRCLRMPNRYESPSGCLFYLVPVWWEDDYTVQAAGIPETSSSRTSWPGMELELSIVQASNSLCFPLLGENWGHWGWDGDGMRDLMLKYLTFFSWFQWSDLHVWKNRWMANQGWRQERNRFFYARIIEKNLKLPEHGLLWFSVDYGLYIESW